MAMRKNKYRYTYQYGDSQKQCGEKGTSHSSLFEKFNNIFINFKSKHN